MKLYKNDKWIKKIKKMNKGTSKNIYNIIKIIIIKEYYKKLH